MNKSELPGFYKLTMQERYRRLGLDTSAIKTLQGQTGLGIDQANQMVENALGILSLPFGVCVNLRVDGRDRRVPLAIEEPSVIAAASHAAKLLRAEKGMITKATEPIMIGQVQLMDVANCEEARDKIFASKKDLIALANKPHDNLIAAGGGAIDIELNKLTPVDDDPLGDMLIVHLVVNVQDAMGANLINSMCERLAPKLEELSGGRARLRILSNLTDRRTVNVKGKIPFSLLEGRGCDSGEELARGIEEASVFAERDPYRAATHNKGIMNGVDGVLLAFGQDWRAVEAGAHAFAARDGRYTALARWRVKDGYLSGEMELPIAVGIVGGVAKVHPTVQVAKDIAEITSATDLACLTAAVGLAQNLGALRALAAEGIQHGHMRLHARNVAVEAGANHDEVALVAAKIAERGKIDLAAAKIALKELRTAAA